MDGYEATKTIRDLELNRSKAYEREASAKPERVPIIAMAAHAMKVYRQRCLEAGMDD